MLSPQDIDAVQPLPTTNRTLTTEEIDSAPVDFSLPKSTVTLSPNTLAAAHRPLLSGPTSTTAGGPPLHLNDSGGSPIEEFEQMDAPEGPAGIPQRAIQGGIAAVRTIGRAVGAGGNILKATTGDVIEAPSQIAGYRQPFRNVRQYIQQAQPVAEIGGVQIGGGPQAQSGGKEKPLPIEQYYNQAGGVERFLGKATLALAEMEPRLAAGYALGAAGAPSAISAGLPMIVTDEGKLDPIGATVAAALPGVHGLGEEAMAKALSKLPVTKIVIEALGKDPMKLKGKVVQQLGGIQISNDAFRKFLESGGGFLAANAYLGTMQGAQHADEIAKMTPEQRADFALDSVAQNIAPAILGFIKPGLSKTLEYKAPEIAPQMAEVAAEIRAAHPPSEPAKPKAPKPAKVKTEEPLTPKDIDAVQPQPGGPNAVNPEQQQTGVQPKRGGADEVGQTGPEASPGNRVPGATGKPPEATPSSGTPPAAPATGTNIQTLTPAIVTEDGQTLTGISHATIRQEASTKGIDAITDAKEGFADENGNFVSRKDGAKWFEQKTGKQPAMPGELHSEDLRDAGLVSISSTSDEGAKVDMPGAEIDPTYGIPKSQVAEMRGYSTNDQIAKWGVSLAGLMQDIMVKRYGGGTETPKPKKGKKVAPVNKTEEKDPQVKSAEVNQNVETGEKFNLAQWVADKLGKGESFKSPELFEQADKHFGGTQAAGKYTPKDAYDQMEAGINLLLRKHGINPGALVNAGLAKTNVEYLKELISRMPTQTARTKEMDAMQQFSTPPPLAYVANWVANIRPGEAMLEPSVGTGDIAVFAKNAGAIVIANELSERRLEVLKSTGIADHVLNLNAEHMHAFLEPLIRDGLPRPTVVVMNPPFSNAAKSGETKNTMIGAKHVEEALKVLAPGGRLVAIVGEGMAPDKATFKDWWRRIQKSYDVLANIGVSGEEYRKYGTSFGNQLLVIDKPVGQPMGGQPVVGHVEKVEELIPLLEGVRNERRKLAAAEPSGADTPQTGGSGVEPQPQPPVTTGNLKPGGRKRPASGGANVLRPELAGAGVRAPAVKPGSPAGGRDQPAPVATPVGSPSDVAEAAAEGLTLEQLHAGRRELSEAGVFAEYHPVKVKIAGAMKHPTPLVEPTAMAAVDPPDPTYKPSIAKEVITSGGLSDAQIENVVYAGQAHERILPTGERMGFFIGDGCVAKGTRIYDPIARTHTPIEQLVGKVHTVMSLTATGFKPCIANITFLKGVADLHQVTLDDGRKITVTREHRFLTPTGWRELRQISVGDRVATIAASATNYASTRSEGASHCQENAEGCLGGYSSDFHLYGGQPLQEAGSGQVSFPSPADARERNPLWSQTDGASPLPTHSGHPPCVPHSKRNSLRRGILARVWTSLQAVGARVRPLAERRQVVEQCEPGTNQPHQPTESVVGRQQAHASDLSRNANDEPLQIVTGSGRSLVESRCKSEQVPQCSPCDGTPQLQPDTLLGGSLLAAYARDNYNTWGRIVSIEFVRRDEFYDMQVPGPENYVAEGFVNHNTGVGKGREIAAIVMDNWNKGRKRAVWVSKTANLMNDAARDLRDLGFDIRKLIDMGSPTKAQKITEVKEGIAFVTYTGLAKNNPGVDPKSVGPGLTPSLNPTPEDKKSRMTLLREWLGKDFDGVIALDECHLAGNAVDLKSNRGIKRASERGKTIVDLQRILPKARIVYVSATGATDVTNFSYGDRLGIWGHGTPFPNKMAFFDAINAGGLSAMEIVARDLKSMGRYMSRTLSFEGVEQRQLAHKLTSPQTKIYNEASEAWQLVFSTVDEMMSQTGGNNSPRARSAVLAALFGAQQRFYNTLLTAMQMPTVIADMREQIAAGNSIILQVVNTNEATLERELANKATEENMDLESLDLSPKDTLIQYVDNNFPTTKYEPVADSEGNVSWRPVVDEKGIPVADPAAIAAKQELLDRLGSLAMPQNPLEMILDTFGHKNVAEVTGRSRRVVLEEQDSGTFKRVVQAKRGNAQRKVEADEFQDGKRRILIFSDAGGTGFSYHASRKVKNQQRRIHYLVQAGWKADAAIQGMGRSHRSDQAEAPYYVLPHTDIRGHQRFISTIARRLGELGALTSGERKATTRGLFDESNNLENSYAEDAVVRLFFDLYNNNVEGFKFDEVSKQMGYLKTVIDPDTGEPDVINVLKEKQSGALNVTKLPSIQQFLNRILAMTVENQNGLFDQFMARMVAAIDNAKASGTFDPGVQTLKALEIRKVKDEVVYQHPDSTAVTRLVEVEHDHTNRAHKWEDIAKIAPHEQVIEFVKNNRSGTIFALKSGPNRTLESGEVVPTYRRISPTSADIQPQRTIKPENFTEIETDEAQKEWERQVAAMPKIRTDKSTYVVGAFLPIWDRLKLPNPKIWRVTTNENETFLGALVPDDTVDALRSRLGAGAGSALTAEQAFDQILDSGVKVELSNGWTLMRTLRSGENRIEITNVEYGQGREITDYIGGYMERIGYTPRYFISTARANGIASMEKIFAKAPPIEKQGSLGTLPSGISVPAAPYEARSVSELRTLLPLVGLDPQAERLLGAFLESPLAKLIEDVRTRVADTLDEGWQGSYFQGLVEIARDADPITGVHEMLHAVWDLLPADIKTELERMRLETINDMIADERQSPNVGPLKELIENPTAGGEAFMAKGYSRDLYPVSSTEEFFAHAASSRFQQRVGSMQEGFWDRVKRFISDFIGAIKRALRLKPTQQEFLDSILRGDFKPAAPEEVAASEAQASLAKERATDIAEGEEEARIPTKIFGERYYVFDREQITPESIAASSKVAKDMLDAAGIPAVEQAVPEDDLFPNRRAWLMPAQGRDMTTEGRTLLKALKREIGTKGGEPKTADRLANIINTIRINTFVLNNTAMHDMSPEVRLELGSIAQAEASFRGAALGALAGYRKDLTVVGRNLDIELGRIWSDAFGGDAIRRVMDELAAAKDRNEDLNKALDELLEREDRKLRRTMGSGSKVGKRMIELIRGGAGEPWELLREIAKSRGWNVPTDADLQKIKELIDQAERIGNLTREELAELGGDKNKIAAAVEDKMMATQERRNVLMKQVRLAITRWTRPLNWRRYWQTPANNAAALNEYAIGNVLLKIGFAVRLPVHIMSQLLCVHVPSRSIGTALANARRLKAKKVDYSMFKVMHQALSDQAKASIASWSPAIRSFAAGLSGSDARNVDRLRSGVMLFERMEAKSSEYAAKGDYGRAAAVWILHLPKFALRFIQAVDNFQGVPAEIAEMRHQARQFMREDLRSPAEIEAQMRAIFVGMSEKRDLALADAARYLQSAGIQYTRQQLAETAWNMVKGRMYREMEALGAPADDFRTRNAFLLRTMAWQQPADTGIGGLMAVGMKAVRATAASKGVPLPFLAFGNAIGTGINYMLMNTPLYAAASWRIPGISHGPSPWFATESDRMQRRVQAILYSMIGALLIAAVKAGLIKVWLHAPQDKADRAVWERQGHRVGTAEILVGDNEFIPFSLTVGPGALISPYLASAGAWQDMEDRQAKRQAKMNEEAQKLGLQPGKVSAPDAADIATAAGAAAWGVMMGNKALSGVVQSGSEFGLPNATKMAASQVSPFALGLPGYQELTRAAGIVMDPKLATFADYLVPLPTSKGRAYNVLGDPVGTPDTDQRIIQTLTAGTYPWLVDKRQGVASAAYVALVNTGFRPPAIDPNRGYAIDGQFRPMTDPELERYTALRSQYLVEELSGVGPEATPGEVGAAYREANQRALRSVGVDTPGTGSIIKSLAPSVASAPRSTTGGQSVTPQTAPRGAYRPLVSANNVIASPVSGIRQPASGHRKAAAGHALPRPRTVHSVLGLGHGHSKGVGRLPAVRRR